MLNDTLLSFRGYTLFAPLADSVTYLIDNDGERVHSWNSGYQPGLSAYFIESGKLLRAGKMNGNHFSNTGGAGGIIQKISWNGDVEWAFRYASSAHQAHHDMKLMPNGNVLMIAWELKTAQQAIAAGRNPSLLPSGELWPDHIIEVQPTTPDSGIIVWEWHVWDHLIQHYDSTKPNYGVVADHPELINLNFIGLESSAAADWNHMNSIDYNPILDQVLVSLREFDEIWIIDHSTTTTEAAGHTGGLRGRGGDLLYRWGNPYAYGRGSTANHLFFGQHNANWITSTNPGTGDVLVFNNGLGRTGGNYSSIDQFTPPLDTTSGTYLLENDSTYLPPALSWTYHDTPTDSFFSPYISGATRQPNGNTLICSGWSGTFFEVTSSGQKVWEYINPIVWGGPLYQGDTLPGIGVQNGKQNMTFRIYRYALDYPGLAGHDLTPQGPIELYPGGVAVDKAQPAPEAMTLRQNAPNPFHMRTSIEFTVPVGGNVRLIVYNLLGQKMATLYDAYAPAGSHSVAWSGRNTHGAAMAQGLYFYRLDFDGKNLIKRMTLVR